MKNLTKSFKVFFIAFLALFLVGVIVTCIFGINAFGSLGKGQQLILNVTAGKDSYDEDIAEVKDYLKEHGAGMITVNKEYDSFDKEVAIVFMFKSSTPIDASSAPFDCVVSDLDNSHLTKTITRGCIALGVALVVVFAYLAIRFCKNNWLANSLGAVCTVVINWLAIFGIVQIAGLLGYQFDITILAAFAYALFATVLMYVVMATVARINVETKKIDNTAALALATKKLACYYWVINVLLAIVCIVLSVLSAGFAIKLIPVAIVCIVCTLSAVYVAPSFWTMFEKTETEKIEK